MTTCDVTFREATQEAAEQYYGGTPPLGFKGYVAEMDGKIVGVGGIFRSHGVPVLFSEMKDEMRPCRKAIAKGVRLLEWMKENHRGQLYAVANKQEPASVRLLKRLGFRFTGHDHEHGPWMVHGD